VESRVDVLATSGAKLGKPLRCYNLVLGYTVVYNVCMTADLYATLGVSRNADDAALSRAYRQAAKRTHPDAGGTAAAFQAVQEAYACLSDPFRRQLYDRDTAEAARPARQTASTAYPWNASSTREAAATSGSFFYEDTRSEATSSPGEYIRKLGQRYLPGLGRRSILLVSAASIALAAVWTVLDGALIEKMERSAFGSAGQLVVKTPVFSMPLFILFALVAVGLGLRWYSKAQVRPSRYVFLVLAAAVIPWATPIWSFVLFGVVALWILVRWTRTSEDAGRYDTEYVGYT